MLALPRLSSLQLLDHVGGDVDPGHVGDEPGQHHIEFAVLRDRGDLYLDLGQDTVLQADPLLLERDHFRPQPPVAFAKILSKRALPSRYRPLGRSQEFFAAPVQAGAEKNSWLRPRGRYRD